MLGFHFTIRKWLHFKFPFYKILAITYISNSIVRLVDEVFLEGFY